MAFCRRSVKICLVTLFSCFLGISLLITKNSLGGYVSEVSWTPDIDPNVTDAFCRCSQKGGDFPPVGLERMGEAVLLQLLEEMRRELRMYIYKVDFLCHDHRPVGINRGYLVEWNFYDRAMASPMRVRNPNTATIFFMPTFIYCWRTQARGRTEAGVMAAKNMQKMLKNVSRFPFMDRHSGKKHIWISAHDMGKAEPLHAWCKTEVCSQRLLDITDMLAINGTLLATTADDMQMLKPGWKGRYGFNSSQDVSLVCNGDVELALRSKYVKKLRARNTSVFFAGRWEEDYIPLRYVAIRSIQEANLSKPTSFNANISDEAYQNALSDSDLCLAPRGSQVHSPRLFEMMWFGCIPVIIADGYHLPSSCFFDWREFSIRIQDKDAHKAGEILKVYLDDPKRLRGFRHKLFQVRRHFMWNTKETPGDAFEVAMLEVYLKQQRQC